jgi:hypothetical protein
VHAETLAIDLGQSALHVAVPQFPLRGTDGPRLLGIASDGEAHTQFTEGGVESSSTRERASQILARTRIVTGYQPFVLK